MEEQKKRKTGRGLLWRGLALLMAVILVVELGIPQLTRVSFSQEKQSGTLTKQAAAVIAAYKEYLKSSKLEQGAVLAKASGNSETFSHYAAKASVAIGQEQYAEAVGYLEKALTLGTDLSRQDRALVLLKIAGLQILCQENTAAEKALEESLQLESGNADALYLRIQLRLEREDLPGALEDVKAYRALKEPDEESLEAFALIYEACQDYDGAIECHNALLAKQETPERLSARARCLLLKEDPEGALKDLERYFLLGGKDEDGAQAMALAGCYLAKGDYDDALVAYEAALEKGQKPQLAMKNYMAAAYLTKEAYDKALPLLEEVLAEQETYGEARYLRGLCLYGQEKYAEALEDFTKALALGQEAINSRYYRALCYLMKEDAANAITDLKVVAASEQKEQADSAKEMLKALGVKD